MLLALLLGSRLVAEGVLAKQRPLLVAAVAASLLLWMVLSLWAVFFSHKCLASARRVEASLRLFPRRLWCLVYLEVSRLDSLSSCAG